MSCSRTQCSDSGLEVLFLVPDSIYFHTRVHKTFFYVKHNLTSYLPRMTSWDVFYGRKEDEGIYRMATFKKAILVALFESMFSQQIL